MSDALLEIRNLKKYFPIRKGFFSKVHATVKAIDDISIHVNPGETLGLVGESGCGKTTTGRCVTRIYEPTSGEIDFEGVDLLSLDRKKLLTKRKSIQMIFQDPFSSLNPRKMVGDIVTEALVYHKMISKNEKEDKAYDLLEKVGLSGSYINRYPHEFSGGQRQRIGIARAIAMNPKLIICDEPVSALDVSVQSQVLNLLMDLRDELGLAYLFIAHNLAVVKHISHRVAVMYLGKIVEVTTSKELFTNPSHPYTQALLSAIPIPDPKTKSKRHQLEGDVPTPINPPKGCNFHTRCPKAMPICAQKKPADTMIEKNHMVSCFLFE